MKTWFTVCVLCLIFIACDDNVEFNQPAFQANIEDVVWQGNTYEASRVSNVLTVLATLNGEKIKLEVPFEVGVDTLGAGRTSNATFTNVNGTEFSTLFSAVNEPTVYYSDGLVSVSEINSVEGYVSGEFWFIGYDNNGLEKVNVTQGVFFKVPLVTE